MQTLLLGKRLTAAVTEHPTEGSLPSQHDTVSECCVWVYRKGKWKNLLKKIFLFFKNGQINLSFSLSGGRFGSVQSDASSSPTEHGHMGHPTYPLGPQVRTHIFSPYTISLTLFHSQPILPLKCYLFLSEKLV